MESTQNWKVGRNKTFIVFCIIASILGTEYSIIIPTLLPYLENLIKTKHPKLMFGAIVSGYYITALIGGVTITRYVDRTRKVKQAILVLCAFGVIGNFVYTVPISALFPLFGRLIQGFGDVCMSIMTGEVARVYKTEDIVSKLSTLTICFYVTFIVAPATNIAFKRVKITICNYRITEANFPSMLVGVTWFICLLFTWKYINNLSLEYDPKTETETYSMNVIQNNSNIEIQIGSRSDVILEQQDNNCTECSTESGDNIEAIIINNEITEITTVFTNSEDPLSVKDLSTGYKSPDIIEAITINSEITEITTVFTNNEDPLSVKDLSITYKSPDIIEAITKNSAVTEITTVFTNSEDPLSLKDLATSFEFNLILLLSFVLGYCSVAFFDIALPLIAAEHYNISWQNIGLLFCLTGVTFVITLLVITRVDKYYNIYYLIIFGMLMFSLSIQCLVSGIEAKHRKVGIVLLIFYVLLLGIGWSAEQMLLGSLLTRIIQSNTQSFAEGIRRSTTNFAYIIAGFITPLMLKYVVIMCYSIQSVIVICFILTVYRRRQLQYPKLVQHR